MTSLSSTASLSSVAAVAALAAVTAPDRRSGAVLVIAGPTASGKSGLALDLARRLDGEIINADSMQVYRDLAILTARPDPTALAAAPHRLYGVLPAAEPCSVARWRTLTLAAIAAVQAAGRLPIVVGGTGLYLRALMAGLAEIPEIPAGIRAAARARLEAVGAARFHAELARRDPSGAEQLRPGDRQRLVRAWEVLDATGRPLADWHRRTAGQSPPGLEFSVLVLDPPRPALYDACNGRFLAMVAAGALDEVRRLDALGLPPDRPALKALGVPELRRHLAGEFDLPTAAALAQQATRNYAKRQVTWFRHQLVGRSEWPLAVLPTPPHRSQAGEATTELSGKANR
jgi:tRNA dimethylallyltransferase